MITISASWHITNRIINSGNRFSSLDITLPEGQESPFKNIKSLEISSTFFSWEEVSYRFLPFDYMDLTLLLHRPIKSSPTSPTSRPSNPH